jgi:hypothetical protein
MCPMLSDPREGFGDDLFSGSDLAPSGSDPARALGASYLGGLGRVRVRWKALSEHYMLEHFLRRGVDDSALQPPSVSLPDRVPGAPGGGPRAVQCPR